MLAVWRHASMNMGFSVAISNGDEMSRHKPSVGMHPAPKKRQQGVQCLLPMTAKETPIICFDENGDPF